MRPWLFSRSVDLAAFGGSALVALGLLAAGAALGQAGGELPEWGWVVGILLVDVAHVWSTGLLILDGEERRRHGRLWIAVPALGYAAGVALYAVGPAIFWRALAYVAVFHFVRQQWGWVALYRARGGEVRGKLIDAAAIYAATLYPLVFWHTHLPRRFAWFLPGDFAAAPAILERVAFAVWAIALALYAVRSAWRAAHGSWSPGKDLVVVTTAACWYLGIVALDSDYAFTVTNVFIHGVPYVVLVFVVARARRIAAVVGSPRRALIWFVGTLWAVAFVEELLWDRAIWHERSWLFGPGWELAAAARPFLVPLLALPQLTHYVLDGFLWRRAHRGGAIR